MQLDLYIALGFIKSSLNEIKVNSIRNCFIKAGFNINITSQISTEEDIEDIWIYLSQLTHIKYDSFESYINVDINLVTFSMLSDEEIIKSVQNVQSDSETEIDEEQSDKDNENEVDQYKEISSSEAFDCLNKLEIYFSNKNSETDYDFILKAQEQLSKTVLSNLKQTKITDFQLNYFIQINLWLFNKFAML